MVDLSIVTLVYQRVNVFFWGGFSHPIQRRVAAGLGAVDPHRHQPREGGARGERRRPATGQSHAPGAPFFFWGGGWGVFCFFLSRNGGMIDHVYIYIYIIGNYTHCIIYMAAAQNVRSRSIPRSHRRSIPHDPYP